MHPALAQVLRYKRPVAAPSYIGPGDIVSSVYEFHGFRAVDAAYAASLGLLAQAVSRHPSALHIEASTYDLHCLANGMPDLVALDAWKATRDGLGDTGYNWKIIYGQRGAFNLVDASTDKRYPEYLRNEGPGSNRLAMYFDASGASNVVKNSATYPTTASPHTVIWSAEHITAGIYLRWTAGGDILSVTEFGGLDMIRMETDETNVSIFGIPTQVGDGEAHFYAAVFNGASSLMDVDGVEYPSGGAFGDDSIPPGSELSLMSGGTGADHFGLSQTRLFEIVYANGAVLQAQRDALRANKTAFGIIG